MKKILLASTILVGSAGVAAAENANFTFSGDAYMGVGWSTNAGFGIEVTSSATLGMKIMSDGGLEGGASVKVSAPGISFGDDNTAATFGTYTNSGMSVSDSSVYISGDWGKLTVAYDADGNGIAMVPVNTTDIWDVRGAAAQNAANDWDINLTYSNTWGDFSFEAYYTFAPNVPAPIVAGAPGGLTDTAVGTSTSTNGDFGAMVTYAFADYKVYLDYDFDRSDPSHNIGVGGSATFSGFTAGVDFDWASDTGVIGVGVNGSYTTGAITVGAFATNERIGTPWDFGANGAYDLGGGMKVVGEVKWDGDTGRALATGGVSLAF